MFVHNPDILYKSTSTGSQYICPVCSNKTVIYTSMALLNPIARDYVNAFSSLALGTELGQPTLLQKVTHV